jgi:hypothetical protein
LEFQSIVTSTIEPAIVMPDIGAIEETCGAMLSTRKSSS